MNSQQNLLLFFDIDIQMDPTTNAKMSNSSSTGCTLKFFSQSYENILINDKAVVTRKSLNFEKSFEIKVWYIKTIIIEHRLFDKVNIKAFVRETSPVTQARNQEFF